MASELCRRVGYCIENVDGTMDIAVNSTSFDEQCYQELNDTLKVVFDIKPIVTAFYAARENYRDLMTSVTSYLSNMKKVNSPSTIAINESLDSLALFTRQVSNFLATASLFLMNAKVRLGKIFGKSSNEITQWDNYRQNLHFNSFAYRFMYELRNYSQHYGLPISGLNLQIDNMTTINRSIDLTIYVCKKDLLRDNYNWKIKAEIEALEEHTDIIPLLNEYNGILGQLFHKYTCLFENKILVCSKYINTFREVFKIPEKSLPMLFISEKMENQSLPDKRELIPFAQFNWVYNKLNDFKENAQQSRRRGK